MERGLNGPRAIIDAWEQSRKSASRSAPGSATACARRSTRPRRRRPPARPTHTLGQVVHNEGVVRDLQELGIQTVETLDDVDHGAAVVIRAHGVRPDVMERAEARGLEVIDGTCTWVIQEQQRARRARRGGLHDRPPRHARSTPRSSACSASRRTRSSSTRKRNGRPPSRARSGWRSDQPVDPAALEVREARRVHGRRARHELKIVNTVCPVTIRRQQDTMETAGRGRPDGRRRRPVERQHQGADPAVRDRRARRAIQIEGVRDLTDAAVFDGGARRRGDRRDVDADRGPARRRPSASSSWPGHPRRGRPAPPSSPRPRWAVPRPRPAARPRSRTSSSRPTAGAA